MLTGGVPGRLATETFQRARRVKFETRLKVTDRGGSIQPLTGAAAQREKKINAISCLRTGELLRRPYLDRVVRRHRSNA